MRSQEGAGSGDIRRDPLGELLQLREEVHRRADRYEYFKYGRLPVDEWRLFFGATDALFDSGEALWALRNGLPSNRSAAKLACYGFLQALYVQQDAIATLWRAVGLKGSPLKGKHTDRIRELRNRLVGHPARTNLAQPPSSAILTFHNSSSSDHFGAAIYYDGDFESLDLSISELTDLNAEGLLPSLKRIAERMDQLEGDLRRTEAAKPLAPGFENTLGYVLEKLRGDIADDSRRRMAFRMLTTKVEEAVAELSARQFSSEASAYHSASIFAGIRLGEALVANGVGANRQEEWWVISAGIVSHVEELRMLLKEIDDRMNEPLTVTN